MTRSALFPKPLVTVAVNEVAGQWRLYSRAPGRSPVEITLFRQVYTEIGSWTLADPYGPKTFSIKLPAVTLFDKLGSGDLEWVYDGAEVDLVYVGAVPAGYPKSSFRLECSMTEFARGKDGLSITLRGAMMQVDDELAKPEYPTRPIPYEWAIAKHFRGRPDLRLKPLKIEFPSWWNVTYKAPPKETRQYLIPTAVLPGQKWTGLTTRQTGSFDPALSSYIQTMLASMYTARGRWTLDLDPGRQPVLRHRDFALIPDASTLVLDMARHGVDPELTEDYSQTGNVFYGQGVSLSGEGYTGQVISNDGERTSYEPLAALRQVHPIEDSNGWLQPQRPRREVKLDLPEGLTETQAQQVAQDHMRRYLEPGYTGTISLLSDPEMGLDSGVYLPRLLIQPGMSVFVPRLGGHPFGVMLRISDVTSDPVAGSVQLTVDSKQRDALTVSEVRLRGRDALQVARSLQGGQYTPSVPDLLLPWNYSEGSGYIPQGNGFSAQHLFDEMPDDIKFPWVDWTTTHPPSDPAWRKCYIGIGPKSVNADNNWAVRSNRGGTKLGFPIKMAQAGTIRRLEIAAFDGDGNILPVKFHFSLYGNNGVNVRSMPRLTAADSGSNDGYKAGQHYPFFAGAWETHKADGTSTQTEDPVSVSSAGLVRAWGTRFVGAGYWPGSPLDGQAPTGLLVDDTQFPFDTTQYDANFSTYAPQQISPLSGYLYAMLYCDQQLTQSVYFVGRMFRVEPGATV